MDQVWNNKVNKLNLESQSLIKYIAVLALIFIYSYIKTNLTKTARKLNKISGAKIIPIFGNSAIFLKPTDQIQDTFSEYISKYGKVCRFWQFHQPKILVADSSACEKILSSTKMIDKGMDYHHVLKNVVGNGLLLLNGERWRRDRKVLNPAFSQSALTSFMSVFNKQSIILRDKIDEKFQNNTEAINVYPIINLAATEIIFQTALGYKLNLQSEDEHCECIKNLKWLVKAIQIRIFKPWMSLPLVWKFFGYQKRDEEAIKYFHILVQNAISQKQKQLNNNKNLTTDDNETKVKKLYIDILLQSDINYTEKYIVDHLMNVFGAGAETVAFSVNTSLFYLALHPTYQKRVYEELQGIFGDGELNEDEITVAQLSKLKYLEMCWKEAMRLSPSVPFFSRNLTQDVKLETGLTLPKGSDAVFLINDLHRDPSVFPNPEQFNPERFLPEEVSKRSAYSYLPFSMGIRNCIGHKYAQLEAKTTLAHILRHFEVTTAQKQSDIKFILGIPSDPQPDIKLAFKRRS